jgi:phosphoribosyl-AMP cyclohydrolase
MTPPNLPDFKRGTSSAGGPLLPAIAQDAVSGTVLMFAWMNEEAFQETLQSGQAVYFSRSRGKLWRKGETSGHQQTVVEIRVDCDADAILLRVEQIGAACHEGFRSCFFRKLDAKGQPQIDDEPVVDPHTVYKQ